MAYVNIDLENLDDQDLIDELESRGYRIEGGRLFHTEKEFYVKLFELMQYSPKKLWKMISYDIYEKTGRIVTRNYND